MSILERLSGALPIGLQIGERAFALCELKRTRAGAEVRRVVFGGYGEKAPGAAIAAAVREQGWLRRACVVGVAPESSTLQALHLPPMPARERLAAARLEAARNAAYRDEPLAVDVVAHDGGWLLAAAPDGAVRAAAEAAEAAGLRAHAVDLEVLAMARVLDLRPGDAVLELGSSRSVVTIAADGAPFSRILSVGVATLLERAGTALGMGGETMERRALALGADGVGPEAVSALAAPVAETLEFARSRGFGTVRRFVLGGEGAALEGLGSALAAALRMPVEAAAPRVEISTERYPADYVRATSAQWLTACGLALWGVRSLTACA
ncbi:MAG TPA: hypothetical protein VNJ51_05465 [Candidatus Dormibacteraeota bacterium]|nr:hypothetical protein [Candidatus Dormibacteraeota bacterium]